MQTTKTTYVETDKYKVHVTPAALTPKEKEILLLIGEGLSTKMIASHCFISVNTVETHRRHLLEKLNAKNSMQLIREAGRLQLL